MSGFWNWEYSCLEDSFVCAETFAVKDNVAKAASAIRILIVLILITYSFLICSLMKEMPPHSNWLSSWDSCDRVAKIIPNSNGRP